MGFPGKFGSPLAWREYRRGDKTEPRLELSQPAVVVPTTISKAKKVFIYGQSRNYGTVSRTRKNYKGISLRLPDAKASLVKIIGWVPKKKVHLTAGTAAGQSHMKRRVTQKRFKIRK